MLSKTGNVKSLKKKKINNKHGSFKTPQRLFRLTLFCFLVKFHEADHSHPTVFSSPKSYHTEYTIVIS